MKFFPNICIFGAMTQEPTYRKCDLSDLDTLVRIGRSTFNDAFAKDNKPENIEAYIDKAFTSTNIERELLGRGSEFYFALNGKEVIGYFKINYAGSQTDLNDRGSLELERFYVLSKFRNKGYGKQILTKAIVMAQSRKLKYIWLGVWEKNTSAIRFYERNGFIKFDEHPFYMGDELQTDYLMKLTL